MREPLTVERVMSIACELEREDTDRADELFEAAEDLRLAVLQGDQPGPLDAWLVYLDDAGRPGYAAHDAGRQVEWSPSRLTWVTPK